MNIWIIDHYSSEPKHGGISRQYDFAKELSKRGHNVLIVSSAFSHYSHKFISEENCYISEIDNKAWYAYLRTTPYKENGGISRIRNTFSFVTAVKKYAKDLFNQFGKPDVVVGCSIHPFTWIAAYKVSKRFSARFFAEVRDFWPATQILDEGMSKYHPQAIALGMLEKWAYKRAEYVIYSMSRGDKYLCDMLGLSKSKVCWIAQPMDCKRFDDSSKRYNELPDEIRSFIGDSFVCVFTGYYMDYEGVHEILEAAKLLKEKNIPVKFVMVGSGTEEGKMKRYAVQNGLDNVLIGGRISKELVPALLKRAQICLAHLAIRGNKKSYLFDASKNKINEYMYSDSCIIYGTYVENQFVQTSGAGYTIEPFDSNAFADAIEKVYRMPLEERAKFGQNAKSFVMENNTVEKLVDKYVDLIEKE